MGGGFSRTLLQVPGGFGIVLVLLFPSSSPLKVTSLASGTCREGCKRWADEAWVRKMLRSL